MSRWPGKYVIGLTGNIGTGKSVVRRMLEHLGAYGIDADAISHRVIEKGAPGYAAVVETFGTYILNDQDEIDRPRLGRIVFNDLEAMRLLENIIHPLVSRAVDLIIQRTQQQVIIIEAIKLLESDLRKDCSSIWVTFAPSEVQLERLVTKRKMSEPEAWQRINAQSPQQEKIKQAKVVIQNHSTFEDTWKQVLKAWKAEIPPAQQPAAEDNASQSASQQTSELRVEPGRPAHAAEIAAFFRDTIHHEVRLTSEQTVMKAFGDKAFLLLREGNELVGIAGWQVENLITRTTELFVSEDVQAEQAFPLMMEYIENQSIHLKCEISFVFLQPGFTRHTELWEKLGYQQSSIQDLGVPVWMDAARESMQDGSVLFYKQLREDRILRPI